VKPESPNRPQTDRADQTRTRILDAAIGQFSENGLAGARTEEIAAAAGVNKALLYYYFRGKDALYLEALETVAERVVASSLAVLSGRCSAGERLVRFALNHFDRIHSQRAFQSLMQQELMRLRQGEENALTPLVEKVFRPMMNRFTELLTEGMRTRELIRVDEWQMMYAALGANVFYFLSGPVMGLLRGNDPFAREALKARRKRPSSISAKPSL
jgi:TetR/AcrR family transcriptional regulator